MDASKKRPNDLAMIMAAQRNEGKLVVITGAARGLGRAMALEFAAQGHRVAGCSRNEKKLQNLGDELGDPHMFEAVDVTDDQAVSDWAESVLSEMGVPDLLINNAAVINRNRFLWDLGAAEFDEVIDINIKGVTNVIRHFFKPMAKAGHGVIVNFSSGWGRSTSPEVAPYCATKWAMEGLTQALAQELPQGVAAIPLNPGVINTDMLQSCLSSMASRYQDTEAWARKAIPFILNLSSADNGQSLSVP